MKKLALVFIALCLSGLVTGYTSAGVEKSTTRQNKVTIIDERGKLFEIPQPLKRVCVFNPYNLELVRAVGGWDTVVGIDSNTAKDMAYWPGFDTNNIVGSQSKPDYEKIAFLKPQVVIFPSNGAWKDSEEKLTPFGIQVVVLTGWDMEGVAERMATLGHMFGSVERSQELIDFYKGNIDFVQERIATLESKKTVYYESSTADYTTCLVGSGHNDMIELAGGVNIFGDINFAEQSDTKGNVHSFEIDPEAVLLRNPHLVLRYINSLIYTPPAAEDMQAQYESMLDRPGWDTLDAVMNDNVYISTRTFMGSCSKMVGMCFLSKWLYPGLFADFNPEAVMREWIENFQGLEYPGSSAYVHHP